jgi:hypothetical protein
MCRFIACASMEGEEEEKTLTLLNYNRPKNYNYHIFKRSPLDTLQASDSVYHP